MRLYACMGWENANTRYFRKWVTYWGIGPMFRRNSSHLELHNPIGSFFLLLLSSTYSNRATLALFVGCALRRLRSSRNEYHLFTSKTQYFGQKLSDAFVMMIILMLCCQKKSYIYGLTGTKYHNFGSSLAILMALI